MPTEIDLTGVNPVTFPEMATWNWQVPAYLFLGGLVAGLMILSASLRQRGDGVFALAIRIADIASLPILALGLLMLWLDLSNRWNAWRFFTAFKPSSAMSWGSWILLLSGIVFVARVARHLPGEHGLFMFNRPFAALGRTARRVNVRTLDVVTILLGIGLGFYTGVLLSTIAARPLWNSAVLAPLFLISGLASGGAFLCIFITREAHMRLVPLSLLMCGAEGLLLSAYLISLSFGTLATQRASDVLLGGGFGWAFWLGVVTFGLAVPVTIETADWLRRKVPEVLGRAAPLLKLLGSAVLRFVIVFAGLQTFL